jgi:hypothetical protein
MITAVDTNIILDVLIPGEPFGESSKILLVPISSTSVPGKNDVRHFQALEKLKLTIGPGGLICLAGQSLPLPPSTLFIPLAAL